LHDRGPLLSGEAGGKRQAEKGQPKTA